MISRQTLQPDLADRLADPSSHLSPAEQAVIEHLLRGGPEVLLWSAARLGTELGVSDATVVRAAQALGYRGLRELREALTRWSGPPLSERLPASLAGVGEDGHQLRVGIDRHLETVAALARSVTVDAFDQAVDVLAAARRIVFRGTGPSAAVASYGALQCGRIGASSLALTGAGSTFADELLGLAPGDALIVLAYGRVSRPVRALLDRTEALEVPVILITDTLAGRLGDRVRVVLRCGRGAPALFASHGATVVLVEQLVLALAARDRDRAERTLADLDELRSAVGH